MSKSPQYYQPEGPYRVSSNWSPSRTHPKFGGVKPHQGQDWAAPQGTAIPAVADGKVVASGVGTGYGNYMLMEHEQNGKAVYSFYAHMDSLPYGTIQNGTVTRAGPLSQVGDEVHLAQGATVGPVGKTGLNSQGQQVSTGYHLHVELRTGMEKGQGYQEFIKQGQSHDPRTFDISELQHPDPSKILTQAPGQAQTQEPTQGREQTLESSGMAAILEQNPAPIMRRGHSNEGNVRELQTLLTANGYDVDGVDGKFGAKTETALRAFQEKSGLGVDGVYGNKTQEALRGTEQARQAALAAQKIDPTQEAGIADPTLQGQTPEAGADGGLTPEAPPKEQVQGEVPAEGERDRVAEFKESFLHTMGIYSEMTPEERDRANIEVQRDMQTGIDAGNKQKEQQAQEQGGSGPVQEGEGGVVAGDEGAQKAPEPAKEMGLADYFFSGLHLAAYGMQAFGNRDLSMTGLFLDRAVDVFSRIIGINDRTQEAIEREHTDIGQARQDYPSGKVVRVREAYAMTPTSITIDGKEHDISSFKMAPGATVAKNADGTMLAAYDKDADRLDIFHRSSSSKGPVTSIEGFSKQTDISYSGQSQEQGQQGRSQDMTASR